MKLDETEFKSKNEKKQMEEKITLQINNLEDIKKKLEVIQKNRWWPVPQFSDHTESYFIPGGGKKKNAEGETNMETIHIGVQIKKEPEKVNTKYTIYLNSAHGEQEKRELDDIQKSDLEEFDIKLDKLDDIANYTAALTGTVRKKGFV